MKYIITIGFIISFGFTAIASTCPSDKLIDALIKVESNGRVDTIGDNGKAVGFFKFGL